MSIWPALHGTTGEDGALLSLLETTGIPFVGARGDDASLAWLKPVAKALIRRAGYRDTRLDHARSRDVP